MPPTDELFDDQKPSDAATGEPTAAAVATPTAPLTTEQVQALVAQQVAPVNDALVGMRRENDALKLALQQATQGTPNSDEPTNNDGFVADFNKDPYAAIKRVSDGSSSEALKQLAPHFNTLINSANEAFLGAQQTRIEQEFGSKAWNEVFRPQLADTFTTMRRENPFAVADIHRVQREVNTIIGANFSKLTSLRDDHVKGRTSVEQANVAKLIEETRRGITTNLTGGVRHTPKGGAAELTPEMRSMIADMDKHTGERTNLTEFTKNMVAAQNSRDIDDWLANTKQPAGREQPAGRAN